MAAGVRVNPTRMELSKTKKRLKTAVRGHKLLKDKQDEMARQFIQYIRRNKALREETSQLLANAMGQMAIAQAQMGSSALEEALFLPSASADITLSTKNIMSMEVPKITLAQERRGETGEGETDKDAVSQGELPYGFAFTSERLDEAVLSMEQLLPKLLELAQVEKTCDMLADEMERTRRRVNALEYVMIPEMERTIKYISMKLEDNERGNLTRLMKVKELMAAQEEVG